MIYYISLRLKKKFLCLVIKVKLFQRLGIPAYNWWNEALHGVASAGNATIFPQAIGMAASFNDDLLKELQMLFQLKQERNIILHCKAVIICNIWVLLSGRPILIFFVTHAGDVDRKLMVKILFLTATMGTAFVQGHAGQ